MNTNVLSSPPKRIAGVWAVIFLSTLLGSCGEKVTSKFVPSTDTLSKTNQKSDDAAVGSNGSAAIPSQGDQSPGSVPGNQTSVPGTEPSSPTPVSTSTGFENCSKPTLVKQFQASISFPDLAPGKTCAFGASQTVPNEFGNLSKSDSFSRAHLQQNHLVSVPKHKSICSVSLTQIPGPIRYDDEIFLLLQGKILASSKNYNQYFDKIDDLFTFSWPKLRTKPYSGQASLQPYCAGNPSQCSIPLTETTGQLKISIDQSQITKILTQQAGALDPNALTFSMITTGDNDNTDCRHSPVNLELQVSYVE